ncbi:DUF2169 family type VI secretion system accessory protein [Paraliomyxa miuraensis]|uniref:DUF2169 family type VI secretion system accessory protein n=1 Tax=Paraliomyxa miuraensis TaxID=376150 RepID=UPI00225171F1|nr:DUF2169 domain-containing protein [Paraliomyxa miuraensis]MCX4241753.1 DUF2169 domain-containing protein [Paraliomyxa miuraensis]
MLQLRNTSPFVAEMFGFPDCDGVDTLFVVVKGTFRCTASGVSIAEEQQPVILADEYWGEPGESSLRRASEAHPCKLGTDVVVVGEACALGERPVTAVDVSVGIANQHKQARVVGERYWTEGIGGVRPTRPKSFVRLPVTWERAFGGKHVLDPNGGTFLAEPRNPVGCGFLGKRAAHELLGQPAPNVEDPRSPIEGPSSRGKPVGFGPIAPSWAPRVQYAGTYDEAWESTRAPYLPRDFDRRFLSTATEELWFPRGLAGGEPVAVSGFHPRGRQRFDLPRCALGLDVTVAGKRQRPQPRLETVVLEPTEERFSLSWRASLPVDKKMLKVEQVDIALERIEGVVPERRSA